MTTKAEFQFLFDASRLGNPQKRSVFDSLKIDDQQLFLRRAIGTHLAPILHTALSTESLNSDLSLVANQLQNAYNQVLSRNIVLQSVFVDFVTVLNKNGIPIIPLKGIYLCEAIYQDIGLRHLSDIDVLIKDENLDEVCNLMADRGWDVKHTLKRSELEDQFFVHAHPRTLVKNDVSIELHTHLYNGDQVKGLSKQELWKNTSPISFLGVQILQFSNEMILQHLCMHLHKHLFSHELKILSFCDIREFLRVEHEKFSWSSFEELSSKYGYLEEVSRVLYLCHKYWNVDVPTNLREPNVSTQELDERFWHYVTESSKNEGVRLKNKLGIRRRNLAQLNSFGEKFKFLVGFVFPTPQFMRQCYGIETDRSLLLWYIYRPMELSVKLMKAMLSSR